MIPAPWSFSGSVVESDLLPDRKFITSEYTGFERADRGYTVRQFTEEYDDVDDVSEFNEFSTYEDAMAYAMM